MTDPAARAPGRPGRRPSSSRAAIEDAAGELFLEQSYARTTIEQVTMRAGVSRASFFNYFAAKSDLLWGDIDVLVDSVAQLLAAQPEDVAPMEAVRLALVQSAGAIGPDRIPLAVTQWEIMGARDELMTSGLPRFARLAALIEDDLARRGSGRRGFLERAAAFAVVGAVAAAGAQWAAAGTGRGDLEGFLDAAVAPVCSGFTVAGPGHAGPRAHSPS